MHAHACTGTHTLYRKNTQIYRKANIKRIRVIRLYIYQIKYMYLKYTNILSDNDIHIFI